MINELFTIVEEDRGRTITLRGEEPGPEKAMIICFICFLSKILKSRDEQVLGFFLQVCYCWLLSKFS